MTDTLQQLMNMIETTRTVPTVSSFSMIGFAILFIFGAVNCILGYRLLRFWMMLFGFIIGAGIGFGVAYSGGVTEKYMYAAIMVGVGVVLAVIAFVSYKIGIFILGAGIGIGLGIYVFHPTTSLVFFFCLLIGVGLGVLAMKRAREVLIVGTSLLGGTMAGFSAAKLGGLADFPYGVGLSLGFALLGMLIQFATNRRRYDDVEDEYDEDAYDDRETASDYVDPREYIPQKADKKRKKKASEEQRKRQPERRMEPRKEHRRTSDRERQVDIKLDSHKKKRYRSDDAAPEYEKTVQYRPKKRKQKELDLPMDSFEQDAYDQEDERYANRYREPLPIDEEELDEEVLREMMDEDDREGEELWKKISRREDSRKKKNRRTKSDMRSNE